MFEHQRRLSQQAQKALTSPARVGRATSAPVLATPTTADRTFGNQAAQGFAHSCPIALPAPGHCPFGGVCHTCPVRPQAKLKISQPNDKYEQEADRVAEEVMRMPDLSTREDMAIPERTHDECIQRVCTKCEKDLNRSRGILQVKPSSDPAYQTTSALGDQINCLQGRGQPLPESVQAFFEPRFNYDFSEVRIHADSHAAAIAKDINAHAFTIGSHIVFGPGQFSPGTRYGKNLIAHELTHVMQQAGETSEVFAHKEEQDLPDYTAGTFTQELPRTADIFARITNIERRNDRDFDSIFISQNTSRNNTVIVVLFWDFYCTACGTLGERLSRVARPFVRDGRVRFYHVQLGNDADTNDIPNPNLTMRFQFSTLPVVWFWCVPPGEYSSYHSDITGDSDDIVISERINDILNGRCRRRRRRDVRLGRPVEVMPSRDLEGHKDRVVGNQVTRPYLPDTSNSSANRCPPLPEKVSNLIIQLNTRYGQVSCLPPYREERNELRVANCDNGCTRPTTQIHEEAHVSDVLGCCRAWRNATRPVFSARSINQQEALQAYSQWLDWLGNNQRHLEARADSVQLAALRRLQAQHCGQVTPSNHVCCTRVNEWIRQINPGNNSVQFYTGGGLTPCPWPSSGVLGSPSIEQVNECLGNGQLDKKTNEKANTSNNAGWVHTSRGHTHLIQKEEATETLSQPNAHYNDLMIYQRSLGDQIRRAMRHLWQWSHPNTVDGAEAGATILWNPQTRQLGFYTYALGTQGQPNRVQICCPPESAMSGREIVGTIHTHPFPPNIALQEPGDDDRRGAAQIPLTRGRLENYVVGLEHIFVLFRDGRWFRIGRREEMLGGASGIP